MMNGDPLQAFSYLLVGVLAVGVGYFLTQRTSSVAGSPMLLAASLLVGVTALVPFTAVVEEASLVSSVLLAVSGALLMVGLVAAAVTGFRQGIQLLTLEAAVSQGEAVDAS